MIYYALVRPIFKYGSILWDPHHSAFTNKLDLVKNHFLHKLNYKFNNSVDLDLSLRVKLGIVTLTQRRTYLYVDCVHNFLNNNIEGSNLLEAILTLNVPTFSSRNYVPFFY